MTILQTLALLLLTSLVPACAAEKSKAAFAEFGQAYTPAYQRFSSLQPSAIEARLALLGDAGKPFLPQLAALKARKEELNGLFVKANEQALAGSQAQKPDEIQRGTQTLAQATTKTDALATELAHLKTSVDAIPVPPPPPAPTDGGAPDAGPAGGAGGMGGAAGAPGAAGAAGGAPGAPAAPAKR